MQRWIRKWGVAALLLAAGALLRLLFLRYHKPFGGDALVYADLTRNMLQHHTFGFTTDTGIRPTLIRLPGYPLFLAACFLLFGLGNFIAVLWVQLLVDLATCCLLGLLAAHLMGRRAGLITLGLAALCPFTANYSATPLTECLSLFCVALAFLSLERWTSHVQPTCIHPTHLRSQPSPPKLWSFWLIPLAFALVSAVLLRPDQALLAIVVLPAMLWIGLSAPRETNSLESNSHDPASSPGATAATQNTVNSKLTTGRTCSPPPRQICPPSRATILQRIAPAAAVALAVALPLLLWAARNWRVFHVLQPLAPRYANDPGEPVPFGFQRWYRTWAVNYEATVNVYWRYDDLTLSLSDLPPRAFDTPTEKAETARIFAEYNNLTSDDPQLEREFAALAAQRIAAHPFRYYVELPAAKLADMWLRPRTELMKLPIDWWRFRSHPRQTVESAAYAALNLAYLILAAIGLWRWRQFGWSGRRALAWALIASVLLRCALLWTLDNSEPRYTLECFPIIFLWAGFALARSPAMRAQEDQPLTG